MPDLNNSNPPNPNPGWFSRLSRRTQALLLALLMFTVSAGAFLFGMDDKHAHKPGVIMVGKSDWTEDFFGSAFAFILGAALLAVAIGWKPENSKIKLPK